MTVTREDTATRIEAFIRREAAVADDDPGFTRQVNLFDTGYLDSLTIVALTVHIEETLGVPLSDTDLFDPPIRHDQRHGRTDHSAHPPQVAEPVSKPLPSHAYQHPRFGHSTQKPKPRPSRVDAPCTRSLPCPCTESASSQTHVFDHVAVLVDPDSAILPQRITDEEEFISAGMTEQPSGSRGPPSNLLRPKWPAPQAPIQRREVQKCRPPAPRSATS
ncbi:acyl carrier protein [Streptomyces sp. NPDC059752]|uniref:acyl carrier protein n=1 Tax=unclassified Streptomyces TaxID=2593676 RepID=UPI00365E8FE0